ncbi:uncharacterized protein SOCEGT47_062390 [Sorangium cellulosum]|uniref:Uncharacterized protein n=1 Tax=Sorangium cellulosum TaxID=56 RepID=A0A4P2Q865_SORCE|nr:uncharacterized protein SOCEGT47_062390 [Sorangium cellulosum]
MKDDRKRHRRRARASRKTSSAGRPRDGSAPRSASRLVASSVQRRLCSSSESSSKPSRSASARCARSAAGSFRGSASSSGRFTKALYCVARRLPSSSFPRVMRCSWRRWDVERRHPRQPELLVHELSEPRFEEAGDVTRRAQATRTARAMRTRGRQTRRGRAATARPRERARSATSSYVRAYGEGARAPAGRACRAGARPHQAGQAHQVDPRGLRGRQYVDERGPRRFSAASHMAPAWLGRATEDRCKAASSARRDMHQEALRGVIRCGACMLLLWSS